jgi:hypothetical protein
MSRRRFRKGRKITSLRQLATLHGQRAWIYYRHKPLHYGWWSSMPLHALHIAISRGYLRRAVEVES